MHHKIRSWKVWPHLWHDKNHRFHHEQRPMELLLFILRPLPWRFAVRFCALLPCVEAVPKSFQKRRVNTEVVSRENEVTCNWVGWCHPPRTLISKNLKGQFKFLESVLPLTKMRFTQRRLVANDGWSKRLLRVWQIDYSRVVMFSK